MKACRLLILVVISLFSMATNPARSVGSTSSVPFLYYYSYENSAFIVERADGTDRRILASYQLTNDHMMTGPGWSHSGDWLAWKDDILGGSTQEDYAAWYISENGGEPINIVAGGQIIELSWSPIEDRLLVGQRHNETPSDIQLSIFLPDTEELVALDDISEGNYVNANWTPDGEYIAMYHPAFDSSDNNRLLMSVFSKDGEFIRTRTVSDTYGRSSRCALPAWSSDGKVIYYLESNYELIVEDFESDTQIVIDRILFNIYRIDWNPTGDHALIYTSDFACRDPHYDSFGDVWLLSVDQQTVERIESSVVVPRISPDSLIQLYPSTSWSPDGSYAAYIKRGRINLITASTGAVSQVEIQVNGQDIRTDGIRWVPDNRLVTLQYDPRSQDDSFYMYYASRDEVELLLSHVEVEEDYFSVSPDGDFLAYRNFDCGGTCVLNKQSGDIVNVSAHADTPAYFPSTGDILWHPTKDWFLIGAFRVSISRWLNVATVDGSVQRDLRERLAIFPSAFGWMPKTGDQ